MATNCTLTLQSPTILGREHVSATCCSHREPTYSGPHLHEKRSDAEEYGEG